ncbi:hypothetical protein BH09ACT12_BH09ACT12_32980 [soil metagenome]
MDFFRDEVWLRRATGTAILFGLAAAGSWRWRESITSGGSYDSGTADFADLLFHASLVVAVVAALYVAINLLLTPSPERELPRAAAGPSRSDWDIA